MRPQRPLLPVDRLPPRAVSHALSMPTGRSLSLVDVRTGLAAFENGPRRVTSRAAGRRISTRVRYPERFRVADLSGRPGRPPPPLRPFDLIREEVERTVHRPVGGRRSALVGHRLDPPTRRGAMAPRAWRNIERRVHRAGTGGQRDLQRAIDAGQHHRRRGDGSRLVQGRCVCRDGWLVASLH